VRELVILRGIERLGQRTWISAVRFCMMAQMSLVSLGVKLEVSAPGVVGAVLSSMVSVDAVVCISVWFVRERGSPIWWVDVVNMKGERMRERWILLSRDCLRYWNLHVNMK
jgi:hypothetical protein